MKIIILTPSKNNKGGVERFSFYLRDVMQKRGHKITLLGSEDLNQYQIAILNIMKIIGFEQPVLGYFLGKKAKKNQFDVCITNGMLGWNISNKKVINVQHGTFVRAAIRIDRHRNYFKYLIKRYIWGEFEGLSARRSKVCIAVSEETKESVEKFYGVQHVDVILNAVNVELFHPIKLDKKDQVIFVGRNEYAKGKSILDGMKSYLESKGWVLFIAEQLSQEDLVRVYNESKIFLLPSLHEGCSYALLDAMACGLPFLSSPVGLVSEFQKKGLFLESIVFDQTVDGYSHAFEKILQKNSNQIEDLSRQMISYINQNHSIDLFSERYSSIIESL